MNIANRKELLDRLAASYALGTLKGGARRRFETHARKHPNVRAAALLWQERFAAMTELQASVKPGQHVWQRIESVVSQAPAANTASAAGGLASTTSAAIASATAALEQTLVGVRASLGRWRFAALAGGLAGSVALVASLWIGTANLRDAHTQAQAQAEQQTATIAQLQKELLAQAALQQVQYVAVLADDKSQASILVTFDPIKRRLVLQRVGGFQEADNKSLQLWALPNGAAPQSLGVLSPERLVRISAGEEQVQGAPALAISLEPKGGVPSAGGPTGPVLFKGALLKTEL
jgi:anti-sigma-K factor RskA